MKESEKVNVETVLTLDAQVRLMALQQLLIDKKIFTVEELNEEYEKISIKIIAQIKKDNDESKTDG